MLHILASTGIIGTVRSLMEIRYTPTIVVKMIMSACVILFGIFWRLYIGCKLVEYFWWAFERLAGPQRELRHMGKWTIVTGGTDGIGKAMAIRAFEEGQNIFIIGRDSKKLTDTKKEIELLKSNITGSLVETLQCDLDKMSEKELDKMADKLRNLPDGIALLINAAGISYTSATLFEDLPADRLQSLINLNLTSTIRVSQKVYQIMKESEKGTIVCLGSGSSTLPSDPLYCVYSASKAGVAAFCENLRLEAQKYNIAIQCHAPLMVPSKLSKARVGMMVPSMEQYVEDAFGVIKNQILLPKHLSNFGSSMYTPSLVHKAIVAVAHIIPVSLWDHIRYNQNVDTRRRYLMKLEKDDAKSTPKSKNSIIF